MVSLRCLLFGLLLPCSVSLFAVERPAGIPDDPDDIFITLQTDTLTPYVQSQVLVKVRLFRNVMNFDAAMSYPQLSRPVTDQVVFLKNLKLNNRQYRTRIDDRLFMVTERNYVMFPQQSGELKLGPVRFEGHVVQGGNIEFIQRESNALYMSVRPIPEMFTGEVWIAARSLEIYQDYFPQSDSFMPGQPIARNLFLSASGLSTGHLPDLIPRNSDGLNSYVVKSERKESEDPDSGLRAVLEQEITIVPTTQGRLRIPSIRIPWWNTGTDQEELIVFEGKTITSTASGSLGSPRSQSTGRSLSGADPRQTARAPVVSTQTGLAAIAVLLLLWLMFRYSGTVRRQRLIQQRLRPILKTTLHACRSGDARNAEKHLLILANILQSDAPVRSLIDLLPLTDSKLAAEITLLHQHNYSGSKAAWDGQEMASLVKQWVNEYSGNTKIRSGEIRLPEVYPLVDGNKK